MLPSVFLPGCARLRTSVPTCRPASTVRKTPLFEAFIYKNESFYQDRLGTNIRKTQKKSGVFRRGAWHAAVQPTPEHNALLIVGSVGEAVREQAKGKWGEGTERGEREIFCFLMCSSVLIKLGFSQKLLRRQHRQRQRSRQRQHLQISDLPHLLNLRISICTQTTRR